MYIQHSYKSRKTTSCVSKKVPSLPFPQLYPDRENRGSLLLYLKRPISADLLQQGRKVRNLLTFFQFLT